MAGNRDANAEPEGKVRDTSQTTNYPVEVNLLQFVPSEQETLNGRPKMTGPF